MCPECGHNEILLLRAPLIVERPPPRWRWLSLTLLMMIGLVLASVMLVAFLS